MSEETMDWLNTMTLIGFTAERGKAWHWREGASNHFAGAIPPEKIIELFDKAHAIERDVFVVNENNEPFKDTDRKAIYIPHFKNVAYIGSTDFQIHQYRTQLFDKLKGLVNGVGFASAGILKDGARAWCQLELPQNEDAAGFKFRVGMLAASSVDGSLSTLFKDTLVGVVCDNTLSAGIWGAGDKVKVKHTSNSLERLEDAGEATMALKALAEKMGYAIEKAARTVVTDAQFQAFLEALVPMEPEVPHSKDWGAKPTYTRGRTLAMTKREDISRLYHNDERAAPWAGSVLGVMQAVNTYNNHEATIRNAAHRAERVGDNLVSGKLDAMDAIAMDTLNRVLVGA